jgi:hypothetical protein
MCWNNWYLGLFYCTAHRRMTEIMLGEIMGARREMVEVENERD